RMSAITSKPPGRRRCSRSKRSQAASSSGRSTWHDATAAVPADGEGTLLPMCGICGLYSPSGNPPSAVVDAMRARIRHRGPDQGSTDAFGACVLGHQRLQVLDPKLGYQPVANEPGDVVAVFNGEIYNFAELRRELAARGHEVRGRGDTPVIPHLYEEYGPAFVERLEGMFAIALWDAREQRLLLARDRLGKKPLAWTRLDDGTVASRTSHSARSSRAGSTRRSSSRSWPKRRRSRYGRSRSGSPTRATTSARSHAPSHSATRHSTRRSSSSRTWPARCPVWRNPSTSRSATTRRYPCSSSARRRGTRSRSGSSVTAATNR